MDPPQHGLLSNSDSNAITPLPTPVQPLRRAPQRPGQFHPRKRRRRTAPSSSSTALAAAGGIVNGNGNSNDDDDDAAIASLSDLTDTHVAALTLRSSWPGEAAAALPRTPALLLRAQLEALVSDGNAVDRQLADLVDEGVLRHIRVPGVATAGAPRDDAYFFVDDFKASLLGPATAPQQQGVRSVVRALVDEVFPRCVYPRVALAVFAEVFGQSEARDAADELIREKCLTFVDETTYAFAVPDMAQFVQNRRAGQKEVLGVLKRAPYCEMPLRELEMRSLKKSIFTAQWHVRDIVGSGVASTLPTTAGTLVRLKHTL